MDLSIFLARLIGLYFLISAFLGITRKNQFQRILKHLLTSGGIVGMSGFISLIIGLAILIGHPVWEWNWKTVISFIGLTAIVKGVLRIAFAGDLERKYMPEIIGKYYWPMIVFMLLLGAFLTYHGFKGF